MKGNAGYIQNLLMIRQKLTGAFETKDIEEHLALIDANIVYAVEFIKIGCIKNSKLE